MAPTIPPADAEFIAHSRADLPALCTAVEQLMAEVEARDERIRVLSAGLSTYRRNWDAANACVEGTGGDDEWAAASTAVSEWECEHGEEVRTDG